MAKKKKDPYKYSYKELQEKYEDNDIWKDIEDAQLAIYHIVEGLRLGDWEIIKKDEEKV